MYTFTYRHYGKQADVLKHLALCEVLKNEKFRNYVETNSACALYNMQHSPEQQYGIYHFLSKAIEIESLKESVYNELESISIKNDCYLGSPGLAMAILESSVDNYFFFDIESGPLESVKEFAQGKGLTDKVKTFNCESIEGTMKLLPTLPASSFIHIDPYVINVKNPSGHTYLDVFIRAARMGMKCLLWYGYMTMEDKANVNRYIIDNLKANNIKRSVCVELFLNAIDQSSVNGNPGVLGSGLLTANLSDKSNATILDFTEKLADIYKDSEYNGFDGTLLKDIVYGYI